MHSAELRTGFFCEEESNGMKLNANHLNPAQIIFGSSEKRHAPQRESRSHEHRLQDECRVFVTVWL